MQMQMQTFKDGKDRLWITHVDVHAIKRVKLLTGVDLLKVPEGQLLVELCEDIMKLVDVLYSVIKPQADAAGVSDEEFGQALVGDALDNATSAFLESLIGFFRKGERAVLMKLLAKVNQLQQARANIGIKRLDAIDLDRKIAEALSQAETTTPGPSSTSSPASAA